MTDPTSRALRVLGLLQSRHVWSGAELAAELGVTERTARRDIARLRELGYSIAAEPGAGGGYSLGRGQIVPPLLLDDDEAAAVTLALTTAAASGIAGDGEAVLRALGKIDDVLPGALRRRLRGVRERIEVQRPTRPVDAANLMVCAEAARRSVRLRFSYRDRFGTVLERLVEPHRVTARSGLWQITAFDLGRDDWRTFRLDRLSDPRPTTWTFTERPGLAEALAAARAPTPHTSYRHQIVVDVDCPVDVLAELLPDESGELQELGPERSRYRSGADDARAAAWWLTRLPHDFVVLGDDAVREAVRELGARLTAAAEAPGGLGAPR